MPANPAHTPGAPADAPLIPGTRKGNLYVRKDGSIAKYATVPIKRLKKQLATERRRVTVLKKRCKLLEGKIEGVVERVRYSTELKLQGEDHFGARTEAFYDDYQQGRNSAREEWNRWLRTSLDKRPKTQYEDEAVQIDPKPS